MNEVKKMNPIELTQPIVRGGVKYPSGTKGYIWGAVSANPEKSLAILMMTIDDKDVIISDGSGEPTDFKYKKLNQTT